MASYPNFVGGTYQSRFPNLAADRSINLYPEASEAGTARSKAMLVGTPGLANFTTGLAGAVRGLWAGGANLCYAVAGSKLYSIAANGTATLLGDVGDDGKPVQMFATQAELFIVSAGKGWRWGGTSVQPVYYKDTQTQLNAKAGAFLDGYFLVIDPSESPIRFRHSAPFDASSWDQLDFASKEANADGLVMMLADHADLYLFGTDTTEVWRRNADPDPAAFPWQPAAGAFMQYGNRAPWATVRLPGGVGWLSGDPRGQLIAVYAQGYQPKRVSTHAVEAAWAAYTSPADAEAYTYSEDGHYFWVITFPNDDATWVYDVTTGLWHERARWDGSQFRRHRSRGHAFVHGKHLVGDYAAGTIYEMSLALTSDAGAAIRRLRRAPYLVDQETRVFHHRFELVLEVSAAVDVTLQWSDDGGKTFNAGKTINTGAPSSDQRIIWRRLGEARHRVYQTTITSSNARVALLDAQLRLTQGMN
jgi:hypothetical protein